MLANDCRPLQMKRVIGPLTSFSLQSWLLFKLGSVQCWYPCSGVVMEPDAICTSFRLVVVTTTICIIFCYSKTQNGLSSLWTAFPLYIGNWKKADDEYQSTFDKLNISHPCTNITQTWCVEFQHHLEESCTACFHKATEDVVPSVVPASPQAPTNQYRSYNKTHHRNQSFTVTTVNLISARKWHWKYQLIQFVQWISQCLF